MHKYGFQDSTKVNGAFLTSRPSFLSPVLEESCYTWVHCQRHCGQVRSKSGTLTSLPSIGPWCPEAFCLKKKLDLKIESKEEGLPRSALWRSCSFCLPSYGQLGNWATSIWTSGNRGGAQAPKPDPITAEPETSHPNIGT